MKKTVVLTIDGKKIEAEEGEKVLWAALDNDIYIPNLCAIREVENSFAGCRLCFIEIEGRPFPVTACTEPVSEGMVVLTRSLRVDRLVKTALELILSDHCLDCAKCPKNRSCEIQKIAIRRGIKLKNVRFKAFDKNLSIDDSSQLFVYDPNKCVLCGKCVWVCGERGIGAFGFAFRGFNRRVSVFDNSSIAESRCIDCGECVQICPVGALAFKR